MAAIEYDPNRSARIALLHYLDGEKRYILAPVGLNVGDMVESGPGADIKPGNALPLENIPVGAIIHNIELQPGKGGQMVRSAGAAAQLMAKEGNTPQSGFLPVSLEWCCSPAVPPSARWATWSTRTWSSAKPDVPGTWEKTPCTRCGHEPCGPSPRRRRRQGARWYAQPCHTLGQTNAGNTHS